MGRVAKHGIDLHCRLGGTDLAKYWILLSGLRRHSATDLAKYWILSSSLRGNSTTDLAEYWFLFHGRLIIIHRISPNLNLIFIPAVDFVHPGKHGAKNRPFLPPSLKSHTGTTTAQNRQTETILFTLFHLSGLSLRHRSPLNGSISCIPVNDDADLIVSRVLVLISPRRFRLHPDNTADRLRPPRWPPPADSSPFRSFSKQRHLRLRRHHRSLFPLSLLHPLTLPRHQRQRYRLWCPRTPRRWRRTYDHYRRRRMHTQLHMRRGKL